MDNLQLHDRSSSASGGQESVGEKHIKWESLKTYVALAYALSASNFNFDIFSMVKASVRIYDVLPIIFTCGTSYAFMDFFIRQYTRKLSFEKSLHPILKGVNVSILMQTLLWSITHSVDLVDALRYFGDAFNHRPTWTECTSKFGDKCVSLKELHVRCLRKQWTKLMDTSSSYYYANVYIHPASSAITLQIVLSALIWMIIFFMSTVSSDTLIKLARLAFLFRTLSTICTVLIMILMKGEYVETAFADIMNIDNPRGEESAMDHVAGGFNIGLIGVYDFGTMSPYTLTDNAVILVAVIFTSFALIRSIIIRAIYLAMKNCVTFPKKMRTHFVTFVLLPVGVELLDVQRLLAIYVYSNLAVSLLSHVVILAAIVAKLIRTEYFKVKEIYTISIMCLLGFALSVPSIIMYNQMSLLKYSAVLAMIGLGGLRTAIIMWMYGVKRFSTDITFWLGFRPTFFWRFCWMILPIVLIYYSATNLAKLYKHIVYPKYILHTAWLILTVFVMIVVQLTTIARFIFYNNILAAFKPRPSYGPPDKDIRKQRRHYSEAVHSRRCNHSCNILDDRMDCFHIPLINEIIETVETTEQDQDDSNDEPDDEVYQPEFGQSARKSVFIDVTGLKLK